MVRVVVKGGVWKNTEDEILKAAISKYGKNQWARISSLLVRKTPKQCKARWYEWLDPSIKKTEWSREEDEKLLHLAKLMPTQWRTIAPIVGRTATQCLERYQRLLDEAEQRDREDTAAGPSTLGLTGPEGGESAPSAEDIRRLRPGEIDPDPETKPARPDAIDMDEDEKEMLSEARARLANTQGKKAKRKARERALEEARRLAVLQKRRELKAAGITTKLKGPKKGMDYMTDIPFEKQPAIGFYDTSEEASRAIQAPVGRSIGQLDNPNKFRKEDEERKRKQAEQEKKKQNTGSTDSVNSARLEELKKNRELEQIAKRRKLELPDALVGQQELDDIVKMGLSSENSRSLVDNQGPTEGLLADYNRTPFDRIIATGAAGSHPGEDVLMREAREIRRMQTMQTPLVHDFLEKDEGGDSVKNARSLTNARSANGRMENSTSLDSVSVAGSPASPLRTPLRDNLGLNLSETSSMISSAPHQARRLAVAAKTRLQQSLMGLPAPKNDFDIVIDEQDSNSQPYDEEHPHTNLLLDAAERKRMALRDREEQEALELARQTQVMLRGLPRPVVFTEMDERLLLDGTAATEVTDENLAHRSISLIMREALVLIKNDSVAHPLVGSKNVGGQETGLPGLPDHLIESARSMLRSEFETSRLTMNSDMEADFRELEERLKRKRSSPSSQIHHTRTQETNSSSNVTDLGHLRDEISLYASDAAKDEKRLAKVLGGYERRSGVLAESLGKVYDDFKRVTLEAHVFSHLSDLERVATSDRQAEWLVGLKTLEQREREGQSTFRDLDEERTRQQVQLLRLRDALKDPAASNHINAQ